jgi:LPXTG-site transpeptidase (sortase) family protein
MLIMKKTFILTGIFFMVFLMAMVRPAVAVPSAGVLGITNTPLGNPTATEIPDTATPLPPTATTAPTLAPTATRVPNQQPQDPTATPTAAALPHTGSLLLSGSAWDRLQAVNQPTQAPVLFSISAPSIFLNYDVQKVSNVNGQWDVDPLTYRVGWIEGSAMPGDETGNIVLVGHLTLAQGRYGPFVMIDHLKEGAEITLTSQGMVHTYRVTGKATVDSNDLSVTLPTSHPTLTLITCKQGSWGGAKAGYLSRLVVTADWVRSDPVAVQ